MISIFRSVARGDSKKMNASGESKPAHLTGERKPAYPSGESESSYSSGEIKRAHPGTQHSPVGKRGANKRIVQKQKVGALK